MTTTLTTTAQALGEAKTPAMGPTARIAGVLFSPRATYEDVAARPRVAGVVAFVFLIAGSAVI
jgi:hypothetical protein